MSNIMQGGLGRKYSYSRHGQLWVATPVAANPSTSFLAQTGFLATTPSYLIRKSDANPKTRTILSKFRLTQESPVAGSNIYVTIMLDSTDRLSGATGTLIPAVNPSMSQDEAESFTIRANATAIAASAAVRTVDNFKTTNSLGSIIEYDAESQIMIPETGSILIYVYATGTAPTLIPYFELTEEPL